MYKEGGGFSTPLREYKTGDIFGDLGEQWEYLPFLRNVSKILKVAKN